ncbi:13849_t:CDS:2 [Ambispora leptoticha]|uniref:13849_t:CDS:1 n=1 Tax=Ambispora leptoticha TaxID=144679 RepID=A0A9N8YQR5_9GLOM|nr:13849_t:CDS:2 [Ambispora leptoticha]
MDSFQQYYIDFASEVLINSHFRFPDSPGIDSIAWLRADVPENGFAGVSFNNTYNVVNADYSNPNARGRYISKQIFDTKLGTAWQLVEKNGVAQFSKNVGDSAGDNMITIKNASRSIASLGVGMAGRLSAIKKRVYVGATAAFKIIPQYYVGIFADLEVGTMITDDVIIANKLIDFNGVNAVKVRAYIEGSQIKIDTTYSVRHNSAI